MRAAIHQLDAALADWRTGMGDAEATAALAAAAASVLDAYAWTFDRGIPPTTSRLSQKREPDLVPRPRTTTRDIWSCIWIQPLNRRPQ